jgi:FAD/FMN-containing dehydrogenase
MQVMMADGSVLRCSASENSELFRATCGGMGLTGVILEASLKLQLVQSAYFEQTSYRCKNLAELFQRQDEEASAPYSVAWVDCFAEGGSLGRSLLTVATHATEGGLKVHQPPKLDLPVGGPDGLMNPFSVQAFNFLYYRRLPAGRSQQRLHYEPFFYPLDQVGGWNKLYGKGGFTQHQFVIPKAAGLPAMTELLKKIAATKRASPLVVLKVCGPQNHNLLSFPMEGYTLAVDFQVKPGLFEFLDELDAMVLSYGGRMYLTKDVHMSEKTFKASYPRWQEFQAFREKTGAKGRFASLQSKRLGLD